MRGAVFFESSSKGIEQILYSLGVQDLDIGKRMIDTTVEARGDLKRMDYKNFNSIQKISNGSPEEIRYDMLMSRVGKIIKSNPDFIKLMSYVILFSPGNPLAYLI